ncbi:hypothetical protein GW17_00031289 [Ensete ventricosum]|nr:hypothetical protein GW17_00031289 [Ensete ventricosum]
MGAGNSCAAGLERASCRTGLGDLPESCVAGILERLDPPEICRLARLCHTFRAAASSDPHTYPIGGPTYVVHRLRRVGFRRHNRWWVGSPDGCVEWKQDVSEPQSPPSAKLVDLELLLTPLVSDPDAYPLKPATTGLRERKLRGANSETTHVGPAQLNRIRLISDRSRRCSWFAEPLRILYVNRDFALMSPKPSKLHLRVWAAWLWTSCTWHLRNTDAPD